MKKILIASCALILTAVCGQAIADIDETYGKMWQDQCKEQKEKLSTCCQEKRDECLENAESEKEIKSCKKKYNVCKTKKTVTK